MDLNVAAAHQGIISKPDFVDDCTALDPALSDLAPLPPAATAADEVKASAVCEVPGLATHSVFMLGFGGSLLWALMTVNFGPFFDPLQKL